MPWEWSDDANRPKLNAMTTCAAWTAASFRTPNGIETVGCLTRSDRPSGPVRSGDCIFLVIGIGMAVRRVQSWQAVAHWREKLYHVFTSDATTGRSAAVLHGLSATTHVSLWVRMYTAARVGGKRAEVDPSPNTKRLCRRRPAESSPL
jgi:hypothetical protein